MEQHSPGLKGVLLTHDLMIVPCTLKAANEFVEARHRHHGKTAGHKFSIACEKNGVVIGVAIVGRPVSRHLDDGRTIEVNRLCTDGTANACSMLYGAAARIAKEMGYKKIITYILGNESGVSLKAAGWICAGKAGGGSWNVPSRPRNSGPEPTKKRYERILQA